EEGRLPIAAARVARAFDRAADASFLPDVVLRVGRGDGRYLGEGEDRQQQERHAPQSTRDRQNRLTTVPLPPACPPSLSPLPLPCPLCLSPLPVPWAGGRGTGRRQDGSTRSAAFAWPAASSRSTTGASGCRACRGSRRAERRRGRRCRAGRRDAAAGARLTTS